MELSHCTVLYDSVTEIITDILIITWHSTHDSLKYHLNIFPVRTLIS
jgi:hypothetical protein